MLQVSAQDKAVPNAKNSITITNDNDRLSPEEIQKMVDDAAAFEKEDKLIKERVEARNNLESYAYTLKRQIEDKEQLGGKINDNDKDAIQTVLDEKFEWLKDHEEADAKDFDTAKKDIE